MLLFLIQIMIYAMGVVNGSLLLRIRKQFTAMNAQRLVVLKDRFTIYRRFVLVIKK